MRPRRASDACRSFTPPPARAGWQISNPADPLGGAAARFARDLHGGAASSALRAKSIALTGFLEVLLERLAPHVQIITPREPAQRGCQLSLRDRARGRAAFSSSSSARGVVCDWREPDICASRPCRSTTASRMSGVFRERLRRHWKAA